MTRWYRAPEVILNASEYTKAVDIWSIGCILGELLGRTALFPGENYLDQIQRIISVLGTPTFDDISYITNEQAMKFIKSLPKRSKQSFQKLFPKANPLAIDLLENMLTFNPHDRYTVEDCLSHPYFAGSVSYVFFIVDIWLFLCVEICIFVSIQIEVFNQICMIWDILMFVNRHIDIW